MESPEKERKDDGWGRFKTIGEERGDDRPDSWIAAMLSKIAILVVIVAFNLFVAGALAFRVYGTISTNFHSWRDIWLGSSLVLILVACAVGDWVVLCGEEARTRKESRRSRSK